MSQPLTAPELVVYADRDKLSRAAADKFVELAAQATAASGRFTVALSGGSTPRELYEQLASNAYRGRIDWSHVQVFWGDERAVPPESPDSNYRMSWQTLLAHVPIPQENVHRIQAERGAQQAADEYEQALVQVFGAGMPRFDLVLLGMGANGHTASLFPHTPVLAEQRRRCAAVWVPELNTYRITLTAPVLNNARTVIFLVAGRDKAATLRAVLRGPYDPQALPAQLIRPNDGKLLWLVDAEAASALKNPE